MLSGFIEECAGNYVLKDVQREERNRDLVLYFENETGNVKKLIIENKVKSMPDQDQLRRYSKKGETNEFYLLLSLAPPVFSKFGRIQVDGAEWTAISYADLVGLLCKMDQELVKDSYHQDIVRDYIHGIECLHHLFPSWTSIGRRIPMLFIMK